MAPAGVVGVLERVLSSGFSSEKVAVTGVEVPYLKIINCATYMYSNMMFTGGYTHAYMYTHAHCSCLVLYNSAK